MIDTSKYDYKSIASQMGFDSFRDLLLEYYFKRNKSAADISYLIHLECSEWPCPLTIIKKIKKLFNLKKIWPKFEAYSKVLEYKDFRKFLLELMEKHNNSCSQIAENYGFTAPTIVRLMKKNDIPVQWGGDRKSDRWKNCKQD